jgi:hypothetical protein
LTVAGFLGKRFTWLPDVPPEAFLIEMLNPADGNDVPVPQKNPTQVSGSVPN